MNQTMKVFLTVDTEVSPRYDNWRETRLDRELDREVYGLTPDGEFGIGYQMDVLNAHGLKAVFFVESLFACTVGIEPLRKIVNLVQQKGHEVQLHAHCEWLKLMRPSILPGRTGDNFKDFSEDEQTRLIEASAENLRQAGVNNLRAFRAGNYGADLNTLRALARNNIEFDTSHNTPYLGTDCRMPTEEPLLQPRRISDVWEFPIAYFSDWPGHIRHAQLCACSAPELENALINAWRQNSYAFVLVSHSFELLTGRKNTGRPVRVDRIVKRRFDRLCRFLDDNRDKFSTSGFQELDAATIPPASPATPLRNRSYYVLGRFAEQVARRVFYGGSQRDSAQIASGAESTISTASLQEGYRRINGN